jgi:hypothetical protein
MAGIATIETYGGPFKDALPVEDPTTEQSSAYGNRQMEDEAHMTRTTSRVIVRFLTTTTASLPATVATTNARSHYGTGPAQHPTSIQKTATGLYTITYPASFTDVLGVVETLSFYAPQGRVESTSVFGHVQCTTPGNNVINVAVTDMAGTLTDLGGSVLVCVESK